MKVESWLKTALADANINGIDAAKICGLRYTNSFYGKLTKNNVTLHDLVGLTAAMDKRVCIVPDALIPYLIKHDIVPDYMFDTNDYLTNDEMLYIYEVRDKASGKLDFNEWFAALSEDERNTINPKLAESEKERFNQKLKEDSIMMDTVNFAQVIVILGKDCKTAYEWLGKLNAEKEPYEEVLNWSRVSKAFDVVIRVVDKIYEPLKANGDNKLKYAIEEHVGNDITTLYIAKSRNDAKEKGEAIAKEYDGSGTISMVRREFDKDNNPVGSRFELFKTWG